MHLTFHSSSSFTTCFVLSWKFLSVVGVNLSEDDIRSFLWCQTCNKTKCEYISCKQEIQNSVFCKREHVFTVETSSPISVMVTTSMETKRSQNEPMTLNSNYVTRYTTEREKVSSQVSARETGRRIGKCLIDLWKRLIHSSLRFTWI